MIDDGQIARIASAIDSSSACDSKHEAAFFAAMSNISTPLDQDPIADLAFGKQHQLALSSSGRVWSCGSNTVGQRGLSHARSDQQVLDRPTLVTALGHR